MSVYDCGSNLCHIDITCIRLHHLHSNSLGETEHRLSDTVATIFGSLSDGDKGPKFE